MFTLRHLGLALVVAAACGCRNPSPLAPTAAHLAEPSARVVGDVDAGGSTMRVAVDITDLQPPSDLAPDAEVFVLWYRDDPGRPWEKLGCLAYDVETRYATFPSVRVTSTSFDLIVTAEADARSSAPSPWILFAQAIAA